MHSPKTVTPSQQEIDKVVQVMVMGDQFQAIYQFKK